MTLQSCLAAARTRWPMTSIPIFQRFSTCCATSSGATAPCSASASAARSSPAPSGPATRSAAPASSAGTACELTESASDDAVLGALAAEPSRSSSGTTTRSRCPNGAERLASTAVAENQAFRIGRAIYGIQFHFEADRRLVREWNVAFSAYIDEHHPDWPQRFESEAERHGPAADAAGLAIARAWVKTI